MLNSSWLQYKFLEDVTEFFSWKAYGQREMAKQSSRIKKRTESGAESDFKLAIIDADDFLGEILENRGYEGKDIEDSINKAGRIVKPILADLLRAHEVRNSIVYNPDFKITAEQARKVLEVYKSAIDDIGMS
jgi:hypothetical protein